MTKKNESQNKKDKNQTMKKYLEALFDEKGIDRESYIEFEDKNGFNIMPYQYVIEFICIQSFKIQNEIKNTLIRIDFVNGSIKDYFKYLAEGIGKTFIAEA